MPSVLFVCTANQVRSPMAAALLQEHLRVTGCVTGWLVESAGTWANDGQPALPAAVQVMRERGIDISQHRARTITDKQLATFNLVLVMTHDHQEALRAEFPNQASRVHLMSELVNGFWDVEDPLKHTVSELRSLANLLERLLHGSLERLTALAQPIDEGPILPIGSKPIDIL